MQLYNNTPNELYYGIESSTGGDCGTIGAGDTLEMPGYDNQTDVVVKVTATPVPSSFSITIPSTGDNTVVTVGMYFE